MSEEEITPETIKKVQTRKKEELKDFIRTESAKTETLLQEFKARNCTKGLVYGFTCDQSATAKINKFRSRLADLIKIGNANLLKLNETKAELITKAAKEDTPFPEYMDWYNDYESTSLQNDFAILNEAIQQDSRGGRGRTKRSRRHKKRPRRTKKHSLAKHRMHNLKIK